MNVDARISVRCKESSDNLDMAILGSQHQRGYPVRPRMVDIGARLDEGLGLNHSYMTGSAGEIKRR